MVFAISFTLRASEVEIKVTKTPERKELTPRLSKDQSKEIAKKLNNILLSEDNEQTELAISRTLSKDPEYQNINLTQERMCAFNQLDFINEEIASEMILKNELSKWALKELSASHNHEREMRKKEQKRKIVVAVIAGITTVLSIAGPIITALLTTNNTTPACTNYTL